MNIFLSIVTYSYNINNFYYKFKYFFFVLYSGLTVTPGIDHIIIITMTSDDVITDYYYASGHHLLNENRKFSCDGGL